MIMPIDGPSCIVPPWLDPDPCPPGAWCPKLPWPEPPARGEQPDDGTIYLPYYPDDFIELPGPILDKENN